MFFLLCKSNFTQNFTNTSEDLAASKMASLRSWKQGRGGGTGASSVVGDILAERISAPVVPNDRQLSSPYSNPALVP